MVSAGMYCYNSSIEVIHEGTKWNVYFGSVMVFSDNSLHSCKNWLMNR